ncbi:putative membrane protein [Shimia isoporae]|uniref:Putative membrane protein n=1 Tax=Shimia isoporae TaxID=647720 RepID=A0A4R1N4F4_9RHOB|nr:DUF2306 domain-containing protein [Shimia isoporae]TCL00585.1 putative membrane protein [Shimia isoporae]
MPDFTTLWAEALPIPYHAVMALAALALGVVQLIAVKGTRAHRFMGYIWAVLMLGTSLTAVFIHEIRLWGLYSPIHLLIPVTLASLYLGIRAARQGDMRRHRSIMRSLFLLALVVTGGFTLLPGRAMHAVLFGG